jgi:hypothetical protein
MTFAEYIAAIDAEIRVQSVAPHEIRPVEIIGGTRAWWQTEDSAIDLTLNGNDRLDFVCQDQAMPWIPFDDSLSSPNVDAAARFAAKYLDSGGEIDLTEDLRGLP